MRVSSSAALVLLLFACGGKSPDQVDDFDGGLSSEDCQCDTDLPGLRVDKVFSHEGCFVFAGGWTLTVGGEATNLFRCGTPYFSGPFFVDWPESVKPGDQARLDYFATGNGGVTAAGSVDFSVESPQFCQAITLEVQCDFHLIDAGLEPDAAP